MKVCVVYDCLFPWTVGGAERWYRNVAERLAASGHDVTYLTLRQWDAGDPPRLPGVRVVAVGPRMDLYTASGRRRIGPPLVFGAGVLAHLLRHGRRYDVLHTASFPYFSVLAAALVRRAAGFRLVVDWHEVWTRAYWESYLGRRAGRVGHLVQRRCVRVPQRAFCFARLTARRLAEEGLRGRVTVLEGEYAGDVAPTTAPAAAESVVVFAGRHIPEKRVPALVPAMAALRDRGADVRAVVFGDGPQRDEVERLVAELDLGDRVELRGFVAPAELDAAMRRALCLVLPSSREGYGMVVVEAAVRGVPSVVVEGRDNAAVELLVDGVNGVLSPSAGAQDLAAAILRVRDGGQKLRESTARWYRDNAGRLSLDTSLGVVVRAYADLGAA